MYANLLVFWSSGGYNQFHQNHFWFRELGYEQNQLIHLQFWFCPYGFYAHSLAGGKFDGLRCESEVDVDNMARGEDRRLIMWLLAPHYH